MPKTFEDPNNSRTLAYKMPSVANSVDTTVKIVASTANTVKSVFMDAHLFARRIPSKGFADKTTPLASCDPRNYGTCSA